MTMTKLTEPIRVLDYGRLNMKEILEITAM